MRNDFEAKRSEMIDFDTNVTDYDSRKIKLLDGYT